MFDSEKLYRPSDPAMRGIATEGTLSVWRCKGQGPPFLKIGSRVVYRGVDLNEWLEARLVKPTDPRPASRPRARAANDA